MVRMDMEMMQIIYYGLHIDQSSSHLNTNGRFWTEGIYFRRIFFAPVQFLRLVEPLPRSNEAVGALVVAQHLEDTCYLSGDGLQSSY